MTIYEVLEKIEETKGTKSKKEILYTNLNYELYVLLDLALNIYKNLGVSKFEANEVLFQGPPIFDNILYCIDKLSTREITGNAARDLCYNTIYCSDDLARKWLIRMFTKAPRLGIAVKEVNKVIEERAIHGLDKRIQLIPEFESSACNVFDGDPKIFKEGRWIIEPKMDGLRGHCILNQGKCTFISRNGKPLYNTELIEKQLVEAYGNKVDLVIDGELMAKDWNGSMSTLSSSKSKVDMTEIKLNSFDVIPLCDWEQKINNQSLELRKKILTHFIRPDIHKNLIITQYHEVHNLEEAKYWFHKFIDEGYEGAVLKRLDLPYAFKRSDAWLKWKEMITEDLKVVGYKPGMKEFDINGTIKYVKRQIKTTQNLEDKVFKNLSNANKNKLKTQYESLSEIFDTQILSINDIPSDWEQKITGSLGAIRIETNGEITDCGSGFSRNERIKYWKNPESLIGKIAEIQYQGTEKTGKLRFPVFLRFRSDKEEM